MAIEAGDIVEAGLLCTLVTDEFTGEFLMDSGEEKFESFSFFGPGTIFY